VSSFFRSKSSWFLFFILGFVPLAYIVYRAVQGALGAEPAKALVEYLGEVAILALMLVLAMSPLRKIKGLSGINRFRRMFGLFVFFYALLHAVSYAFLLVDWQNFIEDLYSRLYVMAGFVAFVVLLSLALTSPKFMVKKLGKRWKALHRLVYVAVIAAVIHVFWQVRSDYTEAAFYGALAVLLLSFRFSYFKRRIFGVQRR
jgi:sulfoxide reductase heme-binding subunit YedZ